MTRPLIDLAKALLNATQILLALCLFLGWKLMAATEGVTANAAAIADRVTPLHSAVASLQEEIASLRRTIEDGAATAPPDRLAALEDRLARLQTGLSEMRRLPQQAAAEAARAGAAELAARLISATPGVKPDGSCAPSGG